MDTHHLLKDDQVMRNTVRIEGPEIIVIDNNKKDKHYCACISHKCGLAVWMYESVRSESMSGSPYLQYHLHRYNKQLLSTSKYYSWFHMVSWKKSRTGNTYPSTSRIRPCHQHLTRMPALEVRGKCVRRRGSGGCSKWAMEKLPQFVRWHGHVRDLKTSPQHEH